MRATTDWYESYSLITSLLVNSMEPPLTPSMFKKAGAAPDPKKGVYEFSTGDLVARDGTSGMIVPFKAEYKNSQWQPNKPLAGIVLQNTDSASGDVRVLIQGVVRTDKVNFPDVSTTNGKEFTMQDFKNLNGVKAVLYDEYAFQGMPAMKILGIDGQSTYEYAPFGSM
jgi:hypothetical protein